MKTTGLKPGPIRQSSDGRWRTYVIYGYTNDGKPMRKWATGTSKSQAAARRSTLIQDLSKMTIIGGSTTVEAFAAHWIAEIAPEHLRPRTLANARSQVHRYINPAIGDLKIMNVGPEEINLVLKDARAAGLASRSVQIIFSTLSTIMRDAMYRRLIEVNPCTQMQRPRATSNERESLTVFEARKVLDTAFSRGDDLAEMWAAAFLMGARKGELIGYEWDRIDLQALLIDRSWQIQSVPWRHGSNCRCKKGTRANLCPVKVHDIPDGMPYRPCHGARVFTPPKSKAGMNVIPMAAPLAALFKAMPGKKEGLVWHNHGGPLGDKYVKSRWDQALEAAGVRSVDFHAARHTTASLLMENGVPGEVIQKILGHSNLDTSRGYMHVTSLSARHALDGLGNLLAIPGRNEAA